MEGKPTPRHMAKGLLSGILPPRPLLLPIVFSLGAKIENVARSTFLHNPTKIVSALRQVRSHLQVDGVACYFDANLEVEALGARLEHKSGDEPPAIHWPHISKAQEMLEGLRSPEEIVKSGRIPVAAEVIRRMNAVLRREFLIVANVIGPMSLARQMAQRQPQGNLKAGELPNEVLEFAGGVATQTVTAFLEAGADVIVIHEELPRTLLASCCEEWKTRFAPAINIARFYEALPVLQLGAAPSSTAHWDLILGHQRDCILCLPPAVLSSRWLRGTFDTGKLTIGIALPVEAFDTDRADSEQAISNFREVVVEFQPAVITTAKDVPYTTDLNHLKRVLEDISRPA